MRHAARASLAPVVLAALLACIAPAPVQAATREPKAGAGTLLASRLHGYPYPGAPDCSEAPGSLAGCRADAWKFFQGQCVSWVAFRLRTVSGLDFARTWKGQVWGGAFHWGAAARAAHLRVDLRPARGAVAWYANHVAFVERVNPDGGVLVSEMNYDNHNGFRMVTISRGYRWPKGFIHVKDLPALEPQYRAAAGGRLVQLDQLATAGATRQASSTAGRGFGAVGRLAQVRDVTGDRRPDLLGIGATGDLLLYRSTAQGGLAGPRVLGRGWGWVRSMADVGSMDGRSHQFVAVGANGLLRRYDITSSGVANSRLLTATGSWVQVVGGGDVTRDGRSDLLLVTRQGGLVVNTTTTAGALGANRRIAGGVLPGRLVSHVTGVVVGLTAQGILYQEQYTATRVGSVKVVGRASAADRLA